MCKARCSVSAIAFCLILGPFASAGDSRPVVAVFDVECAARVKLSAEVRNNLAEYISSRLTESGQYLVIPRDQLRRRLTQEKTNSYKECFEQSCQIEIGKELAAEKTLATRIVKLGKRCTVTLTLYDLKRATTESAASFGPGEAGLDQALTLGPPAGQPAESTSYVKYAGGQLLSNPSGTIEFR